MKSIIVNCYIKTGEYQNEIHVVFENGSKEMIGKYYSDELSFHDIEFLGLTRDQAFALIHQKDVLYLRS